MLKREKVRWLIVSVVAFIILISFVLAQNNKQVLTVKTIAVIAEPTTQVEENNTKQAIEEQPIQIIIEDPPKKLNFFTWLFNLFTI